MLTTTVRKAILEHIASLGNTELPTGRYLALSTTTPNDDGTNFTEPNDPNYQRIDIGSTQGEGPYYPFEWLNDAQNPTYQQIANKYEIHFNTATVNWGNVTHVGIFTNSEAGQGDKLVAFAALTTPVTVQSGHIPTIIRHAAVISVDLDILDTEF